MQTERKEIYSIRREFGWLFLVAGVAGIVFIGVLLFRQRRYNLISAVIALSLVCRSILLTETGGQYPPDGDAGGDDGDDGNRTVCVCAGSLF